jgi:hypothetical protein
VTRPAATARHLRLLLALGLVLLLAVPAAAQEPTSPESTSPEPPDVRLVVTELDGLVGPAVDPPPEGEAAEVPDLGLRVLVENRGEVPVGDLQLVVQVHESVGGARSVLAQAMDGQVVGRDTFEAIERVDVRDGEELPGGAIAGQAITVDGDDIGWEGTNDVYPVEVSVVYGTDVLDRVVTAAVHLQEPDVLERPLQTTIVWPISAPTTRTPAGRYPEALPDELAEGGRLDLLISTLERYEGAPILVAPEAELLEELADRANGFRTVDGTVVGSDDPAARSAGRLLDRLRAAVDASPLAPVVGPYGRADVAALVSAPGEVSGMATSAIETARTRTQALLRAPDSAVYLSTTPMSASALDLTEPGTHLLLPSEQVQGVDVAEDLAVGHARQMVPEAVESVDRLATVADPRVSRILADPPADGGPAVVRQRLVAETALLHLTRPGEAGRSLLVLPPIQWDPARTVAPAMLDALVSSPWLSLTGPQGVAPGLAPRTELSTEVAVLPATVTAEMTAARQQLDALRAAMPSGLPDLDGQTVADLDDALLRSVTPEALTDGGSESLARIRDVRGITEAAFGDVRLPDDAGVTLTSDTGEVPVTLQRTEGGEIELLVEVDSGSGLLWDEGGQQQRITLPEDASRTVAFSARAVARGTFAVTVSVWDPTHSKLLDTATLSVRSTAISRTALAIIGGVVVVLLAVGARRRRTPTLEVVR